jgi:hypothetical protein
MSSRRTITAIFSLVVLVLGFFFYPTAQAQVIQVCDADGSGSIDRIDIRMILLARNAPSMGPDDPMDADGDGQITVRDAKICIRQCTNPRCEIVTANEAPIADAGDDQNVDMGMEVTLDGSGCNDPDNGPDPLSHLWTFVSVPSGSALTNADIQNETTAAPSFIPDVEGYYEVNLHISDGDLTDDDQVMIIAALPNVAPNADAGDDQNVEVGMEVTLDGSGSNDPDNGPDPLSYLWTFVSVPSGSALTNADIQNERSEERRVGKECELQCRSRWSPYH